VGLTHRYLKMNQVVIIKYRPKSIRCLAPVTRDRHSKKILAHAYINSFVPTISGLSKHCCLGNLEDCSVFQICLKKASSSCINLVQWMTYPTARFWPHFSIWKCMSENSWQNRVGLRPPKICKWSGLMHTCPLDLPWKFAIPD
jgi:hypothetical protein